ncbi:MAG: cytochrome c peroxidase [Pseudomonadota bacterium]
MRRLQWTLMLIGVLLTTPTPADQDWTASQQRILRSLSLGAATIPRSDSNRFADHPRAAEFGRQLFFDASLSLDGSVSCASCHQPNRFFTDGRRVGVGIGTTLRNTPTLVGSAWLRWFYWDGRRDSLWAQALIPFEAAEEMGGSRTAVVRSILASSSYRREYERLFGAIPLVLRSGPLPAHASPIGDAARQTAWYQLKPATQQAVNSMFANIGKAIAAYERTLNPEPTRFDRYVESLTNGATEDVLLTDDELAGLALFIDASKTQCLQCHNGPMFTNQGFHNIGTGNLDGEAIDFGRMFGLQAVLMDEFNCVGAYSDATPEACVHLNYLNKTHHIPLTGAFKTPSLRNVMRSAPYFHDGRADDLRSVLEHYNRPPDNNGQHELKTLTLSVRELEQLEAFLGALTSD